MFTPSHCLLPLPHHRLPTSLPLRSCQSRPGNFSHKYNSSYMVFPALVFMPNCVIIITIVIVIAIHCHCACPHSLLGPFEVAQACHEPMNSLFPTNFLAAPSQNAICNLQNRACNHPCNTSKIVSLQIFPE